ncbi:MAG: recombinase family protein, partial [Pseudomonadota bacterium]
EHERHVAEATERRDRHSETVNAAEAERESSRAQAAEMAEAASGLGDTVKAASERVEAIGSELGKARDRAKLVERDWNGIEGTRREQEVRREHLEERAHEDIGIDLAGEYVDYRVVVAPGDVEPVDVPDSQARINVLKSEIKKLGNVNIDAIADEAIRRQLAGEPVTYLVFYDSTRRSRTGAQHWMTVKHRLGLHGIRVIAITRWTPVKMPGEDIMDCIDAYAARQSSEIAANSSARNSMLRLLDGKRNHSSRAPFGLDRLYIDSSDKPFEIVREHPDGRREVIDAETGETKYMLEKGHVYDKSDRHRVELVEGDPVHVEAVRRIFRLKYMQGLGAYRIARILNDDRVPTARGKYWCGFSVDHIARNPVYLGRGRA